jgi:RND superfamily putative drug exporter
MTSLTRFVIAHRRWVIGFWVVLAIFGGFAAGKVSTRFSTDFSIPGKPGYEANLRTLNAFGNGRNYPVQVVYHADSDVVDVPGVKQSIDAVSKAAQGGRVSSVLNSDATYFVSKDGRTTFAQIYTGGIPGFGQDLSVPKIEAALKANTPPGVTAHVTGILPIAASQASN